jgi:hypothetical protein
MQVKKPLSLSIMLKVLVSVLVPSLNFKYDLLVQANAEIL